VTELVRGESDNWTMGGGWMVGRDSNAATDMV
jgi:hypothetical protein